jgi:hypothetical protein
MVSAIVNISFLAAYPIWSVTMIAVDVLVIWALTATDGGSSPAHQGAWFHVSGLDQA